MSMHVGLVEFLTFALYYIILKGVLQLINIEARRNGQTIPAGVSGLFS
jgi:hypothetical protein